MLHQCINNPFTQVLAPVRSVYHDIFYVSARAAATYEFEFYQQCCSCHYFLLVLVCDLIIAPLP
jgi:hypothetical protein